MYSQHANIQLGVRASWVRSEFNEVAAFNRVLWDEKKRGMGVLYGTACRDISGFFECFQEMYDGGYSFTDIAAVFGLSRERVRWLFRNEPRLHATEGGARFRFWDDDLERFVCVTRDEVPGLAMKMREGARERRRRLRRKWVTDTLVELAASMDRQPTIEELGNALWPGCSRNASGPMIQQAWETGRIRRRFRIVMDEVYASAGIAREKMTGKTERHQETRTKLSRANRRLTDGQALDVRRRHEAGSTYQELARRFSVSLNVIARAIRGEGAYRGLNGTEKEEATASASESTSTVWPDPMPADDETTRHHGRNERRSP